MTKPNQTTTMTPQTGYPSERTDQKPAEGARVREGKGAPGGIAPEAVCTVQEWGVSAQGGIDD